MRNCWIGWVAKFFINESQVKIGVDSGDLEATKDLWEGSDVIKGILEDSFFRMNWTCESLESGRLAIWFFKLSVIDVQCWEPGLQWLWKEKGLVQKSFWRNTWQDWLSYWDVEFWKEKWVGSKISILRCAIDKVGRGDCFGHKQRLLNWVLDVLSLRWW